MTRVRCDRCGEQFNSKYNLELHQQMNVCAEEDIATQQGTQSDHTTDGTEQQSSPTSVADSTVGTVSTYHAERGFGFVHTTDLTRELSDGSEVPKDVFIHISDVDVNTLERGDTLTMDVFRTADGLQARNAEVRKRAEQRDEDMEEGSDFTRKRGFGNEKPESRIGPGKPEPTESDIEGFQDERKFR